MRQLERSKGKQPVLFGYQFKLRNVYTTLILTQLLYLIIKYTGWESVAVVFQTYCVVETHNFTQSPF